MTNKERELELKVLVLEEKLKSWEKMYGKVVAVNLENEKYIDKLKEEIMILRRGV